MNLLTIAHRLSSDLSNLRFAAPVTHVYNPLEYAIGPYRRYVEQYGSGSREVLLLGMNPGPWGMAQTGIPFGEVSLARDWLDVAETVSRPAKEHPKRPVLGFDCQRNEVSGARLWGWAKERFVSPQTFFEQFFVANYCPLCFLEESGRNRTPDKLPLNEREPLIAACDEALRQTVKFLQPRIVIGIGAFAEVRARVALQGVDIQIGRILHPSPASPTANRNWAQQAEKELTALGVKLSVPPTQRGNHLKKMSDKRQLQR